MDLPTYLFARREALLHIWRTACANDPSLSISPGLSQEEFNDQIPTFLNLFEQQLRSTTAEDEMIRTASEHGLHRWHKGYSLQELLTELNHFTQCLMAECTAYQTLYPAANPAGMVRAYELVVKLGSKAISGSVTQYDELQRGQAAERTAVLQRALDQITAMAQQRGQFLRRTSHDLRAGFGLIEGAASLLNRDGISEQSRTNHLRMLRRNLLTTGALLSQLTDLSRLEAGQEVVTIQPIDASSMLRAIVESVQPLATERGLTLQADGPESLPVQTDALMIQRIVQNLLLNALQHTHAGLISVSWSSEDNFRWTISVQDTGTGLPARLAASLTTPLRPTLESTSVFEKVPPEPPLTADEAVRSADGSVGEGIGLYVVKLLCQLLNASIDIETRPGQGTLFRVRLLVHASQGEAADQ